jgi:DNA repair exonuclease SbcCD ATPase subunit
MDAGPVSYRKAFWKSPHHAWLGVLTLGLGFLAAQPLFLILGAAAYALGWIYLPDLGFFRHWVDRKRQAVEQLALRTEVDDFQLRRAKLLQDLAPTSKQRYQRLAAVCREIEAATAADPLGTASAEGDPRLQKLDELMWTYLKLLALEQSLAQFLESERQEELANRIQETEKEVQNLASEIESIKAAKDQTLLEAREKLRNSRLELLEVVRKRLQRYNQALSNLHLVQSEEERLEQQIKLLRADSLAIKNTETFSSRIDATFEQLNQTNRWLSEMDDYRDLVGPLPQASQRVGFGLETPPVLTPGPSRKPESQPTRQRS